jgi:phospholipase/carboxylesterase
MQTGPEPVGSVIWLHGLGADGHDFQPIVPELRLPKALPLRFVFPHAPVQPVTINGGMQMRAWFDIRSLDKHVGVDEDGIDESCAELDALVSAEVESGVPLENIVLAGFSQGGVIALHTALRMPEPPAAVIALSTHLPMVERLHNYPKHPELPVFIAHGTQDPVLPLALGEEILSTLKAHGLAPEWHAYPMAHNVCAQEIADIRDFLVSVFQA